MTLFKPSAQLAKDLDDTYKAAGRKSLKKDIYEVLSSQYKLPSFKSTAITKDYLIGVHFEKVLTFKTMNVAPELQANVDRLVLYYEIAREYNARPESQDKVLGLDATHLAEKVWLQNALFTLNPTHEFFVAAPVVIEGLLINGVAEVNTAAQRQEIQSKQKKQLALVAKKYKNMYLTDKFIVKERGLIAAFKKNIGEFTSKTSHLIIDVILAIMHSNTVKPEDFKEAVELLRKQAEDGMLLLNTEEERKKARKEEKKALLAEVTQIFHAAKIVPMPTKRYLHMINELIDVVTDFAKDESNERFTRLLEKIEVLTKRIDDPQAVDKDDILEPPETLNLNPEPAAIDPLKQPPYLPEEPFAVDVRPSIRSIQRFQSRHGEKRTIIPDHTHGAEQQNAPIELNPHESVILRENSMIEPLLALAARSEEGREVLKMISHQRDIYLHHKNMAEKLAAKSNENFKKLQHLIPKVTGAQASGKYNKLIKKSKQYSERAKILLEATEKACEMFKTAAATLKNRNSAAQETDGIEIIQKAYDKLIMWWDKTIATIKVARDQARFTFGFLFTQTNLQHQDIEDLSESMLLDDISAPIQEKLQNQIYSLIPKTAEFEVYSKAKDEERKYRQENPRPKSQPKILETTVPATNQPDIKTEDNKKIDENINIPVGTINNEKVDSEESILAALDELQGQKNVIITPAKTKDAPASSTLIKPNTGIKTEVDSKNRKAIEQRQLARQQKESTFYVQSHKKGRGYQLPTGGNLKASIRDRIDMDRVELVPLLAKLTTEQFRNFNKHEPDFDKFKSAAELKAWLATEPDFSEPAFAAMLAKLPWTDL